MAKNMSAVDVLAVMDQAAAKLDSENLFADDLIEARAAVAELIAALENSDAWIREMRVQHGLQATATLDRNRAALARCKGEGNV